MILLIQSRTGSTLAMYDTSVSHPSVVTETTPTKMALSSSYLIIGPVKIFLFNQLYFDSSNKYFTLNVAFLE